MRFRTGIGKDSHRFLPEDSTKPCILGGLIFDGEPGLVSGSDGDVVLHAICNAITSLTGIPILGGIAHDLCLKDGITDSQVYLQKALETLGPQKIEHVAISIEGKRPRLEKHMIEMRHKIASLMNIDFSQVGITAFSGDGLTECSLGEGVECTCVITSRQ